MNAVLSRPRDRDALFRESPVVRAWDRKPPLVVVGLPRSGSSFLSHLLSQVEGLYVFDDLYLQDKARGIGATGPLRDDQLDELLDFLGWQIRARLRFGLYAIPNVSENEIEPMNDALRACFAGRGIHWTELQEEWMTRIALRSGCSRWGYKRPKSFRSADMLRRAYPGMRLLWLMRNPHDVLASYKHMSRSSQDGDPDQYHPATHALYWRMAARGYFQAAAEHCGEVALVRFEDLIADPHEQIRRIAGFVGAAAPARVEMPTRANSSFTGKRGRRAVTGLEAAMINRICWPLAGRMGFEQRSAPIAAADFADVAVRTGRFARYRLLKDPGRWRPQRVLSR